MVFERVKFLFSICSREKLRKMTRQSLRDNDFSAQQLIHEVILRSALRIDATYINSFYKIGGDDEYRYLRNILVHN